MLFLGHKVGITFHINTYSNESVKLCDMSDSADFSNSIHCCFSNPCTTVNMKLEGITLKGAVVKKLDKLKFSFSV